MFPYLIHYRVKLLPLPKRLRLRPSIPNKALQPLPHRLNVLVRAVQVVDPNVLPHLGRLPPLILVRVHLHHGDEEDLGPAGPDEGGGRPELLLYGSDEVVRGADVSLLVDAAEEADGLGLTTNVAVRRVPPVAVDGFEGLRGGDGSEREG